MSQDDVHEHCRQAIQEIHAEHTECVDELERTISVLEERTRKYHDMWRNAVCGSRQAEFTGALPEFFEAGKTYVRRGDVYKAPEQWDIFRVELVTRHPVKQHLRAIGWMRTGEPGSSWHGNFVDEGFYALWEEFKSDDPEDRRERGDVQGGRVQAAYGPFRSATPNTRRGRSA